MSSSDPVVIDGRTRESPVRRPPDRCFLVDLRTIPLHLLSSHDEALRWIIGEDEFERAVWWDDPMRVSVVRLDVWDVPR